MYHKNCGSMLSFSMHDLVASNSVEQPILDSEVPLRTIIWALSTLRRCCPLIAQPKNCLLSGNKSSALLISGSVVECVIVGALQVQRPVKHRWFCRRLAVSCYLQSTCDVDWYSDVLTFLNDCAVRFGPKPNNCLSSKHHLCVCLRPYTGPLLPVGLLVRVSPFT